MVIRHGRSNVLLLLFLFASIADATEAAPNPIEQLQKKYVGHKAYVQLSTISCWKEVADVVSIVPIRSALAQVTTNALGERVETGSSDTMVELAVKCPNGKLEKANILAEVLPLAISLRRDDVSSPSDVAALQTKYDALVGTAVYSKKGSRFFSIDSSLADLEDQNSSKRFVYLGTLAPLKVEKSKVWADKAGTFLLLNLLSEDSRELFAAFALQDQEGKIIPNPTATLLYLVRQTCFVDGLERDDVVTVGMSAKAVTCQWGNPEKANDYGLGGEQWIYHFEDGRTKYVYLKNGIVSDVQSIQP